jgi:hypothetical protein
MYLYQYLFTGMKKKQGGIPFFKMRVLLIEECSMFCRYRYIRYPVSWRIRKFFSKLFLKLPTDLQGWKVKEFLTKAGQRLEHVQSPSGVFFPGRSVIRIFFKYG